MIEKQVQIPLFHLPNSGMSFSINEIGNEYENWYLAHRPDHQMILWITSGMGIHFIDDKAIEIKKDSFYFINKGKTYQLKEEAIMEGILIRYSNEFIPSVNQNFSDNYYSSLYGYIADIGYFQVAQEEKIDFEIIINQMLGEFQLDPTSFAKRNILQHILLTLLFRLERKSRELIRQKVASTEKKDKAIYFKFMELLEKYFYIEHHVEFYSDQLGIRRRRLSEILKLFTKKSTKTLIQERIILEAKRLLAYTNSNLKNISHQLGFETPTYFSRVFKKHTSLTPLEYQKKLKR